MRYAKIIIISFISFVLGGGIVLALWGFYVSETKDMLDFALPTKIYALVDQEYNIYFDNITSDKAEKYDFTVTSYVGELREKRLKIIPEEAGEYEIVIAAYQQGVEIGKVATRLIVADSEAGRGENRKILFIGDSTIASGMCVAKLNENFDGDVMDITLLGTKGDGRNCHEGVSGWRISDYTTAEGRDGIANVFWNPEIKQFDFSYYMKQQGYECVDYVFIVLGINDLFGISGEDLTEPFKEMILHLQAMISSIHRFNAHIKVGLALTIPPGNDQDSFGKAYGVMHTLWEYKKKVFLWNKTLSNVFTGQEEGNIYLVPIHTNLDTYYNMGLEVEQVNKRSDQTRVSITANGSVHPSEAGYWQLADVYYYFIKACE